jgi:RNA polymerase sigma-70 factor (ECF subfamily)
MHAGSWNGRGTARAWLFQIATNQALNALRARRRRREQPIADAAPPDREETLGWEWRFDPTCRGPENWVVLAERDAEIRQAISRLPPGKAEVVNLMYEQDLTPHEVAEVLGIPQGTVRSRLHYARKLLCELWPESCG